MCVTCIRGVYMSGYDLRDKSGITPYHITKSGVFQHCTDSVQSLDSVGKCCSDRQIADMSVLGEAAHLTDLRAGFGGGAYGYGLAPSLGHSTVLPLWRPTPTHATPYWCSSSTCPCALTRSYIMTDMYDYSSSAALAHSWTTSWYIKAAQDLYKGAPPSALPPPPPPPAVDSRESPSKELPTKILKQERLKDRLELSQTLNFDKDHAARLSRKCAGTQTQATGDLYLNGESRGSPPEYSVHQHLLAQTITSQTTSVQSSQQRFAHLELHDAPLNLSLSTSSGSSPTVQCSRPSVITCATNGGSNGSHSPGRRELTSVEVCDPAIEEHFRRSLGRNYPEYISPKPLQPSPPPPPPPHPATHPVQSPASTSISTPVVKTNTAINITGSVDDHFAMSLGKGTWSAIKAQQDPGVFTGSVDDHFAKALGGDTWLRIKAEKERTRIPNHPHSLPHPIPHPHPLSIPPVPFPVPLPPHSVPQRPGSPKSQKHSSSMLPT